MERPTTTSVLTRTQLAGFIEYAAGGWASASEWADFAVTHHPDQVMEDACRECVRVIAIKGNGDYKQAAESDLKQLHAIARDLKANDPEPSPVSRSRFASFIECAAQGRHTRLEWFMFAINHYHDDPTEDARIACVRIVGIKASGDHRNLSQTDLECLYAIARELRASDTKLRRLLTLFGSRLRSIVRNFQPSDSKA